ncbi:MAG: DUF1573 domain-containing protein [Gemmataceae bacterium]|nr:DUF1573 domain-containing protein [Gemmataceae bacterium]
MASRIVAFLCGSVLVFAGVAKAISLAGTSIDPGRASSAWWLTLAAVVFELFLGGWLFSGAFPRAARVVTVGCFAVFAAVAFTKVVAGESSCGCLGHIAVDPLYTFLFDLAVVAVLVCLRPASRPAVGRASDWVAVAGALVLAAGAGAKVFQQATELTREVVATEQLYHFGEVGQNEELTHEFVVTNRGREPIEVAETTSSCGCTTIGGISGRVVPPGGEIAVPVTLQTGDNDVEIIGRITLACRRAGSDAPPNVFRDLVVTAAVRPDYWVRPLTTDFGVVTADDPVARIIRLRPHRLPDVRVLDVTAQHPAFSARLLPDRSAEGDYQIEVVFTGRGLVQPGRVESPINIRTTSRLRPAVTALSRVYFRPPVTVSPREVVVGADARGEVSREMVVTGNAPIVVDAATADGPVRVAVTRESPTRHRLTIHVPPVGGGGTPNGAVRFRVRPEADPGEGREVVIPVYRLQP